MNRTTKLVLFSILLIAAIASIWIIVSSEKTPSNHTAINETVLFVCDFSIYSDSTDLNTSANGTVFIKGSEETPEQAQIVAQIEIDPDDWGGVSISIPKAWYISGISSSYPGNTAQAAPADSIATWTTADAEEDLDKRIEIGRDSGYTPTGGGKGTVVIDLAPDHTALLQAETFQILVAVGCDERAGQKIVGPDSVLVELPLSAAEAKASP